MAVRHFVHVVASSSLSTAPRLFVMRERDKFTLVDQLELMAKRMRGEEEEEANRGGNVAVKIVLGVGHLKLKIPTKYYHVIFKIRPMSYFHKGNRMPLHRNANTPPPKPGYFMVLIYPQVVHSVYDQFFC